MVSSVTDLRHRAAHSSTPTIPCPSTLAPAATEASLSSSRSSRVISSSLEVLRFLTLILLLSTALSYFITSSLTWGYEPSPSQRRFLKDPWRGAQRLWSAPLELTLAELSLYNGHDPSLPLYLALNHTIYDVSPSPHHYGPGSTYHAFTGRDGARAFVSGCFGIDLTAAQLNMEVVGDLEGVERVFVPFGTPEEDELDDLVGRGREEERWGTRAEERLGISAEEAERVRGVWSEARSRVLEDVNGWEAMLSAKYEVIGRVVGWERELSRGVGGRGVCDRAEKGRTGYAEAEGTGKGVGRKPV